MAARLGRANATGVAVGKAVLSRSSLPALRLLVFSALPSGFTAENRVLKKDSETSSRR